MIELVTVAEYLALDDATDDARLEYVAGHVHALAGASRRHVAITANLTALLHAASEGSDCRVYASDLRLRVAPDLYFYPDVMLVCGERGATDRDETAPTLVAEVLSESTGHRDLGLKLAAYRSLPSLLAYLVVAQDARRVEAHWREDAGSPWRQEAAGDGAIRLPVLGGLALPLERVYARTGV
jgi:Uma2 family endonuclease